MRAAARGQAGVVLGQVGQLERDDAADGVVTDGHAVERIGGLDGAAVVGDDHELDLLGEGAKR